MSSAGQVRVIFENLVDTYLQLKAGVMIAGVALGAKICVKKDATYVIDKEISKVAVAFAEAVVFVSGTCETKGDAKGTALAYGKAEAQAKATATAIAKGFASVTNCSKCKAAVAAFTTATQTIFVKAVAEAEIQIAAVSKTGGSDKATATKCKQVVEQKTAVALASVLAAVKTTSDGSCAAVLDQSAIAGTSKAICKAIAQGNVAEVGVDAMALAGMHLLPPDSARLSACFFLVRMWCL